MKTEFLSLIVLFILPGLGFSTSLRALEGPPPPPDMKGPPPGPPGGNDPASEPLGLPGWAPGRPSDKPHPPPPAGGPPSPPEETESRRQLAWSTTYNFPSGGAQTNPVNFQWTVSGDALDQQRVWLYTGSYET